MHGEIVYMLTIFQGNHNCHIDVCIRSHMGKNNVFTLITTIIDGRDPYIVKACRVCFPFCENKMACCRRICANIIVASPIICEPKEDDKCFFETELKISLFHGHLIDQFCQ